MDTLTQREEGYERAFSHQEELRFRARARRNRLIGEWAGGKLGLSGPALKDYATALAGRAADSADDDALIAGLMKALADTSEHRIRRRLDEFEAEAMVELQAGR
jgi:hypothetical protein